MTDRATTGGLNLFGQPNHVREPVCIHSPVRARQPMSACRICKDDPRLQAWRDWWDAHPEERERLVGREGQVIE